MTYLAAILVDPANPESYATGFGPDEHAAREALWDVLVSSFDIPSAQAMGAAKRAAVVALPAL